MVNQFKDLKGIPKVLYKYRNWSDVLHKTILSQQIVFMANPSTFEDPLDCKLVKRFDLLTDEQLFQVYLTHSEKNNSSFTAEGHYQYAVDSFKQSPMHNNEHIKQLQFNHLVEFFKRFGVLSLTANPFNNMMWTKYSDKNKGFCVGFNSDEMFQHLGGGGRVLYYDELPIILPTDDFSIEHRKQVFSKEKKWEFEEEYRTHKFYPYEASTIDRSIILPKRCFKEVIFGNSISETDRDEIIALCKSQELEVVFKYQNNVL